MKSDRDAEQIIMDFVKVAKSALRVKREETSSNGGTVGPSRNIFETRRVFQIYSGMIGDRSDIGPVFFGKDGERSLVDSTIRQAGGGLAIVLNHNDFVGNVIEGVKISIFREQDPAIVGLSGELSEERTVIDNPKYPPEWWLVHLLDLAPWLESKYREFKLQEVNLPDL